jgi:ubiquinone/menaquinone biosynthesis C-methylase UbiE
MKNNGVVRWAAGYDVLLGVLTLGRERQFRARLLAPAQLEPGEAVLDVGCGTGTLAILAKRQVGERGTVAGIDASPEMIARARNKAGKARLAIQFEIAHAQALPFPDAHFDVVLCTVTLHHLRRANRTDAVLEMRRVLKPGGRLLLADFVFGTKRTLAGYLHHHVGLKPNDLATLAADAGLRVAERGSVGMWDLQYVVALL